MGPYGVVRKTKYTILSKKPSNTVLMVIKEIHFKMLMISNANAFVLTK